MGLKALRLEKGWSQEQLATISGLSYRTIQRAERGETPSLETQRALAASFDLSPARLRALIETPEEAADMATTTPNSPLIPHLTPAWTRVLIAAALYVAVMLALTALQHFAGWDRELLPLIGLVGAGLIATLIFLAMGSGSDDGTD